MDPSMDKAEPASEAGRTPVITYLGRGKTCCGAAVKREE